MPRKIALLIPALCTAALLAHDASAASHRDVARPPLVERDHGAHILYMPSPPGLSPAEAVTEALAHLAGEAPPPDTPERAASRRRGDRVVVFTRPDGTPILPDLERGMPAGLASNELTFTFDSPEHPWTAEEIYSMGNTLDDFYPATVARYGPPAFAITVNVRKDPNLDAEGYYFASSNEIVLFMNRADVLLHEMIHAFHDDVLIGNAVYEEGMTRAMEIEILSIHEQYQGFARHHSYPYFDVNYEMLNKPAVGSKDGNIFAGIDPLLRYQLAGYAWAKPYLENPSFFVDFNAAYYAAVQLDPSVRWSEPGLRALVKAVQSGVEGLALEEWYASQFVLDPDPPLGEGLYQSWAYDDDHWCWSRVNFFQREPWGTETPRAAAPVDWAIFDHSGARVVGGTTTTSSAGWAEFGTSEWSGYVGRAKVVTQVAGTTGPLTDVTWRSRGRNRGIFGVVRDADLGEVEAVHVASGATERTSLTHGCFDLPSMETLAGQFLVTFRYPDGRTLTSRLTKDASHYYTALGAETPVPVNRVANPSFESPGWKGWDPYNGSTLSRSRTAHTGSCGLRVAGPPGSTQFGINDHPNWVSSLDAGTRVRFRAWVRGSGRPGISRLRVREYVDKVRVGGSNYSNAVVLGSSWRELAVDYVVRQTGASLDLQVILDPTRAAATFYVDDVSIEVEDAQTPLATVTDAPAAAVGADAALAFGARVVPNPARGEAVLRVVTTRYGPLRARLFDLAGRAVRTLVDEKAAAAGAHDLRISRRGGGPDLGAGVYFYRIEAGEGVANGRLMILD